MKIKNEKEIFDMYVEDEYALRDTLKKPFIEKTDNRVWASDGRIVIMVNRECVSGEYEAKDMLGKIPVRDFNSDFIIKVSDIEDALGKLPKEPEKGYKEVTCPECGGEGTVEAEYYADYDNEDYTISGTCPICDGTGKIDEEYETGKMIPMKNGALKLREGYIKWTYIDIILKTCKLLDIQSIHLVRTYLRDMNIVVLNNDIHIGLMPMFLENKEGEEIKKKAVNIRISKP